VSVCTVVWVFFGHEVKVKKFQGFELYFLVGVAALEEVCYCCEAVLGFEGLREMDVSILPFSRKESWASRWGSCDWLDAHVAACASVRCISWMDNSSDDLEVGGGADRE
jgi:hypothetical protein